MNKLLQTNVIYHTKYSWVLVIISIYLFYSSGVFFFLVFRQFYEFIFEELKLETNIVAE